MARKLRTKVKKSAVKQDVKEEIVSKHFIKTEENEETEIDDYNHADGETEHFMADKSKRRKTASCNESVVMKLAEACKRESIKKKSAELSENEIQNVKTRKTGTKRKKNDNSNDITVKVPKLESVGADNQKFEFESKLDKDNVKSKTSGKLKSLPRSNARNRKKIDMEMKTEIYDEINSRDTLQITDNGSNCSESDKKATRTKPKANRKLDRKAQKVVTAVKQENDKGSGYTSVQNKVPDHIDNSDVMSVLMHMEGSSTSKGQSSVIDDSDEMMPDSDNEDKLEDMEQQQVEQGRKRATEICKGKVRNRKTDLKEKSTGVTNTRKRKNPDTHMQKDASANVKVLPEITKTKREAKPSGKGSVEKKTTSKQRANANMKSKGKHKSESRVKAKQGQKKDENLTAKDTVPSNINSSDIMSFLMHMEGPSISHGHAVSKMIGDSDEMMMSNYESDDKSDGSDGSEDDWEEVEDHHGDSPKKSQMATSKSVEITLEAPVIYKKRKKKGFNLQDYLKKQVNRYKKELALDMHKVHLLCLMSRGFYLNNLCLIDTLKAQVMSVVMATREIVQPKVKNLSKEHVGCVLKWINKEFTELKSSTKENMEERLIESIETRTYYNTTDWTLICIMVLRHLGFMARLVMSLQPIPYKQAQKNGAQKSRKIQKKPKSSKADSEQKSPKNSTKSKKFTKAEADKVSQKKGSKKKLCDLKKKNETEQEQVKTKRRCSKDLSKGAYKEEGNEDDVIETEGSDSESECEEVSKGKKAKKPEKRKSEKNSRNVSERNKEQSLSSDSDFEENSMMMQTQHLKREPSKTKNKKVLSSDSDETLVKDTQSISAGNDTWLEVYIEAENTWTSVCSLCKEITKPADIRSHASSPVYYVIGVDNSDAVKDVTIRYASEWLTKTRKLRIEDDWWTDTLEPFSTSEKERDMAEDKDMQSYLLQCPMPTSISQFKGHPLYILKRHLLKYEALYPNSIVPVGYTRGEPVYSRDCCHTLHSRENWLKEGMAVRLGEEPYKFVKSRKRWNDKDSEPKDCELFGKWQTEIYMPPPAVDGEVPRNAHGNVEMFKPWMLPAGTVHLKELPGLNRIARKLDLDCAAAMVGWDHHCGFAHPVMDGWIVCEEHKDILLAAWDEEQEIIRLREIEKKDKRVYENWKKLIRGLLIKERLKKRYNLGENPNNFSTEQKLEVSNETGEKAHDVEQSWPRNRLSQPNSDVVEVEKL